MTKNQIKSILEENGYALGVRTNLREFVGVISGMDETFYSSPDREFLFLEENDLLEIYDKVNGKFEDLPTSYVSYSCILGFRRASLSHELDPYRYGRS